MEAQNELGYKSLFGGLIFVLSFASGAVPQIFVGLFERHKNFIGIANAFGGGVFLATAFIHMLPELIHDIEALNAGSQEYPVGFLLVLVGYMALLCLERVAFTHSHHHDEHHHHHGDAFYKIKHHPHHHPEHHNPELDTPAPRPDEHSPLVRNRHELKANEEKNQHEVINSEEHTHGNAVSKLTPVLLLAVLSVHSLFEGLVLGVQESRSDVLAISSAILSHKWVESLSLGLVSIKARASVKFAVLIVALFSFITPIGVFIGYLISSHLQDSVIPVVFNAIALGSFLYIGATEVVGDEFHDVKKKRIRWTKFISLILGASLLCFIRLFIGHDH